MLAPGLLLLVILSLLSQRLQAALRLWLHQRPGAVFAAPLILSAAFCLAAWRLAALSAPLALLVLGYTLVPTACAFTQGTPAEPGGFLKRPTWGDLATIGMLWLPLEFAAGASLVPRAAQGILHATAYGVAITLALILFLGFRPLSKMKFHPPAGWRDLGNVAAGFAVVAPVLIVLGLYLGFLQPFHGPRYSWPSLAVRFGVIFFATALPEEILFRGLIQNWLMQRFGFTNRVLLIAGLIFGCSHLNNAPGPLPNWRYMILATIAGVVYGKVFQKSSSIFASATLHALGNTIKYAVF